MDKATLYLTTTKNWLWHLQGAGWWKYEFCYLKKVDQYHVHEDQSKIVVR